MSNKTNTKKAANKKDPSVSRTEAIERGIQLVESGDRQAAFDLFQQTVELNPDAAEAWVWLGGTSSSIDAAELAFERAYSLDPQNEEAALGLRWVRLQRTPPVADEVQPAPAPEAAMPEAAAPGAAAPEVAVPATQSVVCPNCGTENGTAEKFCVRCGQDLMREAPQGEAAAVTTESSMDTEHTAAPVISAPAPRFDRRVVIGVLVALIVILGAIAVWYLLWAPR